MPRNAEWIRSTVIHSTASAAVAQVSEITALHNNSEGRETWTVVQGFLFGLTDTDNLWESSLIVVHELLDASDIIAATPPANDPAVKYFCHFGRGPVLYVVRRKIEIAFNQKFFIRNTLQKAVQSEIQLGFSFLVHKG